MKINLAEIKTQRLKTALLNVEVLVPISISNRTLDVYFNEKLLIRNRWSREICDMRFIGSIRDSLRINLVAKSIRYDTSVSVFEHTKTSRLSGLAFSIYLNSLGCIHSLVVVSNNNNNTVYYTYCSVLANNNYFVVLPHVFTNVHRWMVANCFQHDWSWSRASVLSPSISLSVVFDCTQCLTQIHCALTRRSERPRASRTRTKISSMALYGLCSAVQVDWTQ